MAHNILCELCIFVIVKLKLMRMLYKVYSKCIFIYLFEIKYDKFC